MLAGRHIDFLIRIDFGLRFSIRAEIWMDEAAETSEEWIPRRGVGPGGASGIFWLPLFFVALGFVVSPLPRFVQVVFAILIIIRLRVSLRRNYKKGSAGRCWPGQRLATAAAGDSKRKFQNFKSLRNWMKAHCKNKETILRNGVWNIKNLFNTD